MIGSECGQYEFQTFRRFNVSDVVTSCAGPAGLGPKLYTLKTLKSYATEADARVVCILCIAHVIALQKLHHHCRAGGVRRFSGNDLHQEARSGVCGQLVSVLAVWSTRYFLATVCIFAEGLLIDVDIAVAERSE